MIITGCQRSGTKTAAKIFGIPHETNFSPENLENWTLGRKESECSWLAWPYIESLKYHHSIIHLVRHPLRVINSIVGIGFWTSNSHEPYRNFILKHLGWEIEFPLTVGQTIALSMDYWVQWNKPLMEYPRIRIEDIANAPKLNSQKRDNLSMEEIKGCVPEALYAELTELAEEMYYGVSNSPTC